MPKPRKYGKDAYPLISRIQVEQLFNTYSYNLELAHMPGPESGRLMLLYGNNGSGKTTILNLLYHLLHPEPYGGHRSFVGRVPFKKFCLQLLDGILISATRLDNSGPESYNVKVEHPRGKTKLEWQWQIGKTRREVEEDHDYIQFCSFLQSLGLSFHYLRDTRRVEGSRISGMRVITRRTHGISDEGIYKHEIVDEDKPLSPDKLLITSVESAIQWFRQRALAATNVGYTSVNTIYRDIIKRIVTAGTSQQDSSSNNLDKLTHELFALKKKNSAFSRFGLTPELDVHDIVNNLRLAQPQHLSLLNTVLGPYLEGHAARLDALNELQQVMDSFVSLLSNFYSHKKINVHLQKGLQIAADTGQDLEPNMLSSGEKQLLLLFCNAISSRQDRTVLMIDEPEISLNVRWQRELIPALLTCMSGTAFQLILATHSVELLSRYRDFVTPLHNMQRTKPNE
jgi:energy-coupling factor transporter ATP-binding protein EcfA2